MSNIVIIGELKSTIEEKYNIVGLLLQKSDGFARWYYQKFLKWDGIADHEDQRVLSESINYALKEIDNKLL